MPKIIAVSSKTLLARLTVKRADQDDLLIEVHKCATFHAFYHYFTQQGRKARTRKFVRTASRNEGLLSYAAATRPGLEILAIQWARMQGVESVSVKIYKKREYKRLIEANPSEMALPTVRSIFPACHSYERSAAPVEA